MDKVQTLVDLIQVVKNEWNGAGEMAQWESTRYIGSGVRSPTPIEELGMAAP